MPVARCPPRAGRDVEDAVPYVVLLFPIPYSLFTIPYSLFPIPYSLFPTLKHSGDLL